MKELQPLKYHDLLIVLVVLFSAAVITVDNTLFANIAIPLMICCILGINLWLLKQTKDRSFLWMIAGLTYGLVIRFWLLMDDLDVWRYPWSSGGAAVMYFMYLGEFVGWMGILRACHYALHNFKKQKDQ